MVRIITDSAADFEPVELEKLNIACVPLKVMIGEEEYEENVNLGKAQFFELLASTGETPKTSQPSPQRLIDLLEDAKKALEAAGAEDKLFTDIHPHGHAYSGVKAPEFFKNNL